MRKLFFVGLLALPFGAFSQKVSYDEKTLMASVDGAPAFKIDRFGCGFITSNCHFEVWDSAGKKVMMINFREFNDPTEIASYNPKGRVTYWEFIFLESKQKAEIAGTGVNTEKMAKQLVKNKLMTGGTANAAAIDEFVLVNGTRYSERAARR